MNEARSSYILIYLFIYSFVFSREKKRELFYLMNRKIGEHRAICIFIRQELGSNNGSTKGVRAHHMTTKKKNKKHTRNENEEEEEEEDEEDE